MRPELPRRRGPVRATVAVGALALAAAGVVTVAAPAGATPATPGTSGSTPGSVSIYSPAYQHPYRHGVVPTREAFAQIRAHAVAPAAAGGITGTGNLKYGGGVDGIGVTTGAPKVYLVFYGSQWGTSGTDANGNLTFSGDINGAAPRLQQLFKGVGTGTELWSGVMTQYCEGVSAGTQTCPTSSTHVGYPTGGALAGVWADTATASPTAPNGHQLGVEAVTAASHFGNTTAAANRSAQYVILSAHNIKPDGFPTAGFCAWHDWNGDTTLSGGAVTSTVGDIAFTNMPYVTDAGTSCGQNFVNAGTAGTLDGVTMVEGHEYAETITDQNPAGGWTDTTGYENADKCSWISTGTGASANFTFTTGTFAMQTTYSNDGTNCLMTHAIVGGGTGGTCSSTGQKFANPGFESGNVSWSASTGVIGQHGTSQPAHSGTWDAWMDGYGATHTDSITQSVTIPAGCKATLAFYLHIDTAETTTTTAYDKLTVKAGSTTVATFSNLDKAAGYTLRSYDVSALAGQTVTVTFTGVEDSSLQTSFVLDDTSLTLS
ncbi:MAG: hypothetical protein HYR62_06680 [Actinobacteria bacterium]|nr:hypothetical protein [Actinomycetota bacterium]